MKSAGFEKSECFRAQLLRVGILPFLVLSAALTAAFAPTDAHGDCAPPPSGLVGWWLAEGNGADRVTGNAAALLNGVTFTDGEVGRAFLFDGVDDRVIVSNAPALNFGPAQNFSIEAWIQPIAAITDFGVQSIVDKRYTPNFTAAVGYAFALGNGKLSCQLADAPLTPLDFTSYTSPGPDLRDGRWHHVAMTVNRLFTNGGHLYVDGNVVLTFDPTVQPGDLSTTEPLRIGNHADPALNSHFKGRIDEVAIYNRALSAAEIQAIFSAGSAGKCATPPPSGCTNAPPGLVSWWRGDGNNLDETGGNPGTQAGNATFGAGYAGQGFVFDGDRDGVLVGTNGSLRLQGFSIEAWIKRTGATVASFNGNGNGTIFAAGTGGGGYNFFVQQSDNRLTLGKSQVNQVSSAAQIADTNWHHVAVTKSGTTVVFYVDGVAYAAPVYNSGDFSFSAPACIGAWWNPYGQVDNSFFGAIDELAVYNRALSAAEVQAIHAAGSAGKCALSSNRPPSILSQPESRTVNAGSTATFTVNASGTAPLAYQWFFGIHAIGGATMNALVLSNVQPANAGNYSVVVSNAYGTATSSNAVLKVLTYPPTITTQPKSVTTNQGKTVSFTAAASGTAPLRYQWQFNEHPLPNQTSTTLTLTNVQFSQAGKYRLRVTNAYGAAISSNALLTVLPPPCVPLPSGAVAWWRCESNLWDSVGLNDMVSPPGYLGPPAAWFTTGKVGVAFRGSTFVAETASDELDVGAGAGFTLEGWIHPDRPVAWPQSVIGWTSGIYTFAVGLVLNGGVVQANLSDTNSTPVRSILLCSPTAAVRDGEWTHLALTFDKAQGVAALYVNGLPVAQTNLSSFRPLTKATLFLGAASNTGGLSTLPNSFVGALDEFTVYSRALSEAEIQGIVAAGVAGKCAPLLCTPPPSDFVAWWRAESNALDNVDSNHGVITGAVAFTSNVVGNAFQFNGGYVRVPASSQLNIGLGSGLTLEAWVKTVLPDHLDVQPLFDWNSGTGTQGVSLAFSYAYPYPYPLAWVFQANLISTPGVSHVFTTPTQPPSSLFLSPGFWQHVALTYDKASGLAALYVNGSAVTQTNLGSFTPRTDLPLYFGYRPPGPYAGSGTKFTGALDEISLYARALTAAEIKAIVKARGEGKCRTLPAIVTQPAGRRVNIGTDAQFKVIAAGNPLLRYQWFKNGAPMAGATGATLTLPAVRNTDAASYAVRVTNWFGSVLSSNAVLKVNHPPHADASATVSPVVAPWRGLATVALDGSRSSDPDRDPLRCTWWLGTNALATGIVAVVHLPAGKPSIALVVDDGLARSTNLVTVHILTPAQAIERLMALVAASVPGNQRLLSTLGAARAALEHGHPWFAILELRVFQFQAWTQVAPGNPALAESLIRAAREVIVALGGGAPGGGGHARIHTATRQPDGKFMVRLSGASDAPLVIEASTDLVNWEVIGVTRQTGDGDFEFEDAHAPGFTNRFYRIVPP